MGDERRLLRRGAGGGRRRVPGRAELDAEHPLYILYSSRLDGQAEGHPAHDRRLPDARRAGRTSTSSTSSPSPTSTGAAADVGWVTGHSYIVYGPLLNGATSVMYEGAPDYPHKGIWWELCERYGVTIFYTAPTAIRACMKWGAEHVEQARPVASCGCWAAVGEPINPKAWLWYCEGRRRRALPGRRHVVADRDRRDHDHDAARARSDEARAAPARRCPGIAAAVLDEEGNEVRARHPGPAVAAPAVAGDAAHAVSATTTASSRPTGRSGAAETYLVGDAVASRTTTATSGSSAASTTSSTSPGHRMSTAEIESAIVSRTRKVAEAAVIGAGRRGHRPVGRRVRHARGRPARAPTSSSPRSASTSPQRIGKLARPKRIIWADDLPKTRSGKIMRRLLQATSPRAASSATSRRCATPTSWPSSRARSRSAQADEALGASAWRACRPPTRPRRHPAGRVGPAAAHARSPTTRRRSRRSSTACSFESRYMRFHGAGRTDLDLARLRPGRRRRARAAAGPPRRPGRRGRRLRPPQRARRGRGRLRGRRGLPGPRAGDAHARAARRRSPRRAASPASTPRSWPTTARCCTCSPTPASACGACSGRRRRAPRRSTCGRRDAGRAHRRPHARRDRRLAARAAGAGLDRGRRRLGARRARSAARSSAGIVARRLPRRRDARAPRRRRRGLHARRRARWPSSTSRPSWPSWPCRRPRCRPSPQEAAARRRARRCSSSRPASPTPTSPRAARARRRCWPRRAPTACGSSAPTRSASSTPTPRSRCRR